MAGEPLSKTARERLEKQRIEQRYRTTRTLIRVAGVVACFWLISEAISDLAGKETSVLVLAVLSIFADLKFALTIGLFGLAAAWAALERSLRHNKVEYLQGRIRQLEKGVDPKRSTSGLTPRGKTHPTDRG